MNNSNDREYEIQGEIEIPEAEWSKNSIVEPVEYYQYDCVVCGDQISKKEWFRIGVLLGEYRCLKCNTIYKPKHRVRVYITLFLITIPLFSPISWFLKLLIVVVTGSIGYLTCDRTWFDIKK